MHSLRSLCRGHGAIAALIVALALALKALIPGGYMISTASGLAIVPCPAVFTLPPAPAPSLHHDHHAMMGHGTMGHHAMPETAPSSGDHDKHAAAQQTCPYAVLSLASLTGADPIQLALALAFALALGFAPWPVFALQRPLFLRPPLRAPPRPL